MFEIVCYNSQGSAFYRFTTDEADITILIGIIPSETFGILIHDAATGAYLDRA